MNKPPKEITLCSLEVVVMPNGEVICAGKTVGWVSGPKSIGQFLTPKETEPRERRVEITTGTRHEMGG